MLARQLWFDGSAVSLREHELAPPSGAQALIRAEYSNISIGTELAYIRQSRKKGEMHGLGYSLVGTVEQVGDQADVEVGQRVLALEPHASVVIADASPGRLVPVPADLDPALATIGVLASVSLHIAQRAQVRLGESAVVFGHGIVGALAAQFVRMAGAGWLGIVEPDETRRQIARQMGMDVVMDPTDEDLTQALAAAGYPDGVDVSVDVAGHASVYPAALDVLRLGGRLVCGSGLIEGCDVPLYPAILLKELTVIGALQPTCPLLRVPYYPHSQFENRRWAMQLMAQGRLPVEPLATHRIPWQEAAEIYTRLESERSILGAIICWETQ